jgi:hypothetical protein
VYGTLAAKKDAVEAELQKLSTAPDKIMRLAGWDWIRQSVIMRAGLSHACNAPLYTCIKIAIYAIIKI